VLVAVSAHGSATERNRALASTICLTIANRSNVLRAPRVDARYRDHIAGANGFQHLQEFAPIVLVSVTFSR
jgi:hypothetical protein